MSFLVSLIHYENMQRNKEKKQKTKKKNKETKKKNKEKKARRSEKSGNGRLMHGATTFG
jgi:hypothetical protein